MRAREELILRVATRRNRQLGGLSEGGYRELLDAVKERPEDFIETPSDEAFLVLAQAIERNVASQAKEEFLDDEEYYAARERRLSHLANACAAARSIDEGCTDALLLDLLAQDLDAHDLLGKLMELSAEKGLALDRVLDGASLAEQIRDTKNPSSMHAGSEGPSSARSDTNPPSGTSATTPSAAPATTDAWDDVFLRPTLRLVAAVVRACLDCACYRMAVGIGQEALNLAPCDALGIRHTCALAYARLEDDRGFEALDARFARRDDAWELLARTILLYKLGHAGAAKRALTGMTNLCEGSAYALLRPILVEPYLPDRPEVPPLSFKAATLAVGEADPIIIDVPDFPAWAEQQRDVYRTARAFAEKNGFEF